MSEMEPGCAAPARILIIDDDIELCGLLQGYLAEEGFESECVHAPADGVQAARSGRHDLILLDVMMPGMNGFDALRKIRADVYIPVLMLTARGATLDRVLGLELGADDYLPKPFDPPELAARIRAILRRVQHSRTAGAGRLIVNDIEVDLAPRIVRRNGRAIGVTMVEFDLLVILLRSTGTPVGREQLAREALHRELPPFDRSIDTHIYNLRKKLGPRRDGTDRIRSVRGEGYFYTEER